MVLPVSWIAWPTTGGQDEIYESRKLEILAAIFNDRLERNQLSFRRKQEDRRILLPYRLGFENGKPVLPKGVMGGQRLYATIQSLTADWLTTTDFNKLPIPFRAVATDIVTGDAVALGILHQLVMGHQSYLRKMLGVVPFPEIWSLRTSMQDKSASSARNTGVDSYLFDSKQAQANSTVTGA